ncbi:MAG: hypothetical protein KJO31_10695 [Gammaproteobacteria bacterium]|nr:hypothetical protein [Gammaproteobacteria bacterium]
MRRLLENCLVIVGIALASGCVTENPRLPAPVAHIDAGDVTDANASLPSAGLLTTGQPGAAMLDAVAAAGFAAVIDFRGTGEDRGIDERQEVTARGMKYFSIPVAGSSDVNFDNAELLDRILGGIDGPVLLHCKSGNRAAAILALREKQNGASAEAALQYGLDAGLTGHRNLVEQRLSEN